MKRVVVRLLIIFVACTAFLTCQAPFGKRFCSVLVETLKQRAKYRAFDPFVHAFFPPRDKQVKSFLCDLIGEENSKIDCAMFQFTDKDLSHALLEAHHRGVELTMVVDVGCLGGRFNQVLTLHKAGVSVSVYPPENYPERYSLMHNKIMLLHSLYCVITGSMNFTNAGANHNQENVLVIQDKLLFKQYADHFEWLVKQASKL